MTRLEGEQRELFFTGVAGLVGVGPGLYGLVFPAYALSVLLESPPTDLVWTLIGAAVILFATAAIAAELIVSVAAIRAVFAGRWPGQRFILGLPAAAIAAATYGLAGLMAVFL